MEDLGVETMQERPKSAKTPPERTCVGCGLRDAASAMVRLVVADDEVVFDLAGGAFGRGAHLHPRPECIAKAPRGLARTFKRDMTHVAGGTAADLAARLTAACDRRMSGLMMAARRTNALAVGADASLEAIRRGAPLAVVAVDAGKIAQTLEVQGAVAEGRAIAWKAKHELGALLGEEAVAICAVRHAGIASELKVWRAAADAAAVATREGAECSRRPEAP
ncbi:MAG TPA: DUF448 domain-containing protein [Polyangiaceae bacterium]|nr:DUF448 domain-containing protein [Polyangiaceae bacterium]